MSAAAPPPARGPKLVPPLGSDAVWAAGWTPAEARLAVDQFKRGTFRWAWQLAIDCTSYAPIKAALEQRLAVPSGLPWTVDGGERAPGRIEREDAERIWDEHIERLVDSTLIDVAMLGMSVWHHPLVVDPETLRTTLAPYTPPAETADLWTTPSGTGGVQRWPLSAVGWTPYPLAGVVGYYAIATGGQRIQLPRPGTTEGEWTVIGTGKGGDQPHLRGAVVALDMLFTGGMLALRARSNLGVSAGRASPVGTLPPNTPMRTVDDQGRPIRGIAEDSADVLAAMGTEQTAALFPHGMVVTPFELTTTGAAAYFHGDMMDSLLMVALAILGHGGSIAKTDAQYRSEGGREVDVPEALNRRDVGGIERGASGLFAMLAKLNSGLPPSRAPKLCGHLPDADQAEHREALGKAMVQVAAVLKAEADAGCAVTQDRAIEVAALLLPAGSPPPIISSKSPARINQWHVEQKIVAPDQALASLGLPALPDGAGSVERLAAERLSGKDQTGKPASEGDATIDASPPDVPAGAAPAPAPIGPSPPTA